MGWRSAVHPEDVGRLLELRDPAVEEGQGFQADIRLRDREGDYRWHIVRSVPVCDESGRVIRRFGTASDIDDRRRAEEALRASEQRFRFLAESIPHLVWTCRARRRRWTTPAPGCVEYLGISLEEPLLSPPGPRRSTPRTAGGPLEAWERSVGEGTEFQRRAPPARRATGNTDGSWATPCRSATTRARWSAGTAPAPTSTRGGGPSRRSCGSTATCKARVDELETLFETVPIGIAIGEDTGCAGSGPTRRWSGCSRRRPARTPR